MVDAVIVGQFSGDADHTTTAGTTTTGSTFVILISFISSAAITSVTDSKGNTYTLILLETSGGQSKAQYRCHNGTGGASHTATVQFSGSSFGTTYLVEVTGAATSSLDVSASANDAASPYTSSLGTLAQADEVIISIIGNESGGTVTYSSSNTTIIADENDGNAFFTSAVSKQVVSSTSAFSPSFTSDGSGTHTIVSASFKAAASGASITGSGALSIPGTVAAAGTGAKGPSGTGALALAQVTVAGSGTHSPPAITFFGAASNPADGGTLSDSAVPIAVTPPASMVANDLVIVRVAFADTTTTRDIAQSNTGGQTWTAGPVQDGSPLNTRTFWCTFNGTWSANPSWTHGGAAVPAAMSVVMEVWRPSASFVAWTVDVAQSETSYSAPGSPFDVTITGRTAIANSTVTSAAWIGGGNQTWTLQTGGWQQPQAQWRNNPLSISTAHKIQTVAGATGNVTNRQNSGAAGWADIITFAESVAAPVTGDGALTLATPTAAGSGVVGHTGTGTPAITQATVAGAGDHSGVPEDFTGTGAPVITNTTAAGTAARGSNDMPGDIALTLPTFTSAGEGIVTPPSSGASITGAGSVTLYNVTVAGAVLGGHPGTGALTLPNVAVVAGSGSLGHVGTGALTLGGFQVVGTNIPRAASGRGVNIRLGLGL